MTLISKFSSTLATTLALLSSAYAIEISENTIYQDLTSVDVQDITVDSGAFFTLLNIGTIKNTGNLDVSGELYISSTDGEPVSYYQPYGSFSNTGEVSIDSRTATSAGYIKIGATNFENDGKLWLGTSSSTLFPKIAVDSTKAFVNNGQISVEQTTGIPGYVQFIDGSFNLQNNGHICLKNVKFTQWTDINGGGSFALDDNAELDLGKFLSIDQDQTIAFIGENALLSIIGLTEALTGVRTYTVVGYGQGNTIEVSLGFTSYDYSGDTLNLSFLAGLFQINFKIGEGYNSNYFQTDGILGGGWKITYNAPPPSNSTAPASYHCDPFPTPQTSAQVTSSAQASASSAISSISSSLASVVSSQSSELSASAASAASSASSEASAASSISSVASSAVSSASSEASSATSAVSSASSAEASESSALSSAFSSAASSAVSSALSSESSVASSESSVASSAASSAASSPASSVVVASSASNGTTSATEVGTTYTTEITTTESNGAVTSGTATVIVTIASNGEPVTTTEFVTLPAPTSYSTTFASTESDGSVSSIPAEVIISYGTDGKPTTVTEIGTAGPATVTEAPTSYSTDYATTLSDGSVETVPGEVIITYGTDGEPTTTTSPLPWGPTQTITADITSWPTEVNGHSTIESGWVYTTTVNGVVTVTTDICPVGSTAPPGVVIIPAHSTASQTITADITSWSTNVNGHSTVESGWVYTTTVNGVVTITTDVCPEGETAPPGVVVIPPSSTAAPAPGTEGSFTTVVSGSTYSGEVDTTVEGTKTILVTSWHPEATAPGAPWYSGPATASPAPAAPASGTWAPAPASASPAPAAGSPATWAPAASGAPGPAVPAPAASPASTLVSVSTVAAESTSAPWVAESSAAATSTVAGVSTYEAGAASNAFNFSWLISLVAVAFF